MTAHIFCTKTMHQPINQHTVLLQVRFTDGNGQEFVWTPRWKDLRTIFEAAVDAECFNTGGASDELKKFLRLSQETALLCEFMEAAVVESSARGRVFPQS